MTHHQTRFGAPMFELLVLGSLTFGLATGCASNGKQGAPPDYPSAAEQQPRPTPGASDPQAPMGPEPAAPMGPEATPQEQPPSSGMEPTGQHQGQQQSAVAEPGAGAGTAVDKPEVEQFAQAYSDIVRIQNDYQQQAASAKSQDALQKLQEEMNVEIKSSIESHGLTLDRFDAIAKQVDADPNLRMRVQEHLDTAQ